jgi:single-strand DNA-binding protein
MAEGLNKVLLLGNLGADPELKVTQGGQAVLKLRLATTEWHSVTVWGRRGEALAKILAKGSSLFVEGRIQTSSYDRDGEKRYRTEIIANNIILTGRGGRAGEERSEGGASYGGGGAGGSGGGGGGGGYGGGGGGRPERSAPPARAPQPHAPEAAKPAAGADPGFDDYGPPGDDEIPF